MYKKDFDKLEKIPNYMLFFGNEFYLQEYENKLLDKFKNENILKMYYDEFDFDLAKTHLSQSSLFGGQSVLIIKHNKIPPKIEKLIEYTKDSYLFFFYYGSKKPDIFKKNFVRFFEPNLREKIFLIEELSKKKNVTITQEAKLFLAKSLEPSFLKNEIEKLSLYKEEIDLKDVKEIVFEFKEESFEDIFVSILKGEDFFEKLNNFLEVNDFKRFLPSFIKYVRDIYSYYLYIKNTGSSSLEGFLGYKLPYDIEKKRIEIVLSLKEKDYYELLKNLLNFELLMRNSDKNKEAVFWEAMAYLKNFKSF
jgi:DNA polymerase-3 subunit delta